MASAAAAAAAKEKGNAAFKAGDYAAAVGHYSAAALADPTDLTFFLNRAAAYLKLSKNEDAERDCTTVLTLSNKNVKALFRRGQARAALQKLGEAHNDLQRALKMEPNNEAVRTELARVDGLITSGKGKARSTPIDVPAPPCPHHRVQAALRRAADPKDGLLNPVSSRSLHTPPEPAPVPSTSASASAGAPKPKTFQEVKQAREGKVKSAGRVGGGIFRMSGKDTVFETREVSEVSDAPAPAPTPAPAPAPAPSLAHIPTPAPAPAPTPTPAALPALQAPRTLFEFTRAWDAIPASDPPARWALLSPADRAPCLAPRLFRSSLEPGLLAALLPALGAAPARAAREYLVALPRTPRFGTVVLFLSSAERAQARAVWDAVRDASAGGGDEETAQAARAWGFKT
ncbi:hypothetical protein BC834DRAFT_1042892 [Gloeopeniophorella convolvens]|nr:hypothetical protein BC834DRAFT_1042892 [Gloeopeniophorella convolvens]